MIELRTSKPEEVALQRALWKKCFGDGDPFISLFYEHSYSPENMLVLMDDGLLGSMSAILPMDLRLPDGTEARAGYIYALSTDPERQKKGYGRDLLRFADHCLQSRGMDCVVLVPAEPSLHRFFSTVDYQECFATRKVELLSSALTAPDAGDEIAPVDAEAYAALRLPFLDGRLAMTYRTCELAFQRAISRLGGGDLFRLTVDGVQGCAAVERLGNERVLVKELLLPPAQQARAAAKLAEYLPAARYHLRTPAFWPGLPGSYTQSFGMIKWYNLSLRRHWGSERDAYLGLGFD